MELVNYMSSEALCKQGTETEDKCVFDNWVACKILYCKLCRVFKQYTSLCLTGRHVSQFLRRGPHQARQWAAGRTTLPEKKGRSDPWTVHSILDRSQYRQGHRQNQNITVTACIISKQHLYVPSTGEVYLFMYGIALPQALVAPYCALRVETCLPQEHTP